MEERQNLENLLSINSPMDIAQYVLADCGSSEIDPSVKLLRGAIPKQMRDESCRVISSGISPSSRVEASHLDLQPLSSD